MRLDRTHGSNVVHEHDDWAQVRVTVDRRAGGEVTPRAGRELAVDLAADVDIRECCDRGDARDRWAALWPRAGRRARMGKEDIELAPRLVLVRDVAPGVSATMRFQAQLPEHLPYVFEHGGGRVRLGRRAPERNRSLHGREHEARRCGSDEPDVVDYRNEESEMSRCLGQFHFQVYPRRVQFGLLQPQTQDSSGACSGDRYAAHEGPQTGSCGPGAARAA